MRRHLRRIAAVATLVPLVLAPSAAAQRAGGDSAARARELPMSPTKPLRFTTDEGTWMSLDVSPDGRTIVFDLLGDLYSIPMDGGRATRLTSGQSFDGQPNYSPDGRMIVFTSDRSGSDNLWLANADGSNPRALTREDGRAFISPTWTPDGKYVVVSRNATTPGFNLYMYHKDGGSGLQLTGNPLPGASPAPAGAPALPGNFVGASFGKDSRFIYAAVRTAPGGGYNQTSLDWQIAAYDRRTGKTFVRTDAVGSGMRPALSPDGKWMTYATRRDSLTSLRLRDLVTGDETMIAGDIQRDDQESRWSRDLVPPYAFTPDSKQVIIAHHGKIWRVAVPDGRQTLIPFSADVDQMIAGSITLDFAHDDSALLVRQIRNAAPSPDGRRLAFTALDKLWLLDLASCQTSSSAAAPSGCAPRRLTSSQGTGEFSPAWSPDGRHVAYVTWNEQGGGDVYRVRADAGGAARPERLSTQPGFYDKLAYAPDGRRIVVARGPREQRRDRDELGGPSADAAGVELVWMASSGGTATVITPVTRYGQPHFGPDSTRLYLFEPPEGLVSMRWDGTDRQSHLRIGTTPAPGGGGGGVGADEVLLSPDGERALVQSGSNVYVVQSVPMIGANAPAISIANPSRSQVPVRRLTRVGGDFARWSADGKHVVYSLGRSYFSYDMDRADSLVRDSTSKADASRGARPAGDTSVVRSTAGARPIYEPVRLDVALRVAKDRPSGTVVLRGARIISMRNSEVIESGDVVVTDNRIAAVGPTGSVTIPAGARVVDVAGKTLLPGWVDIHAHMWPAFGVHRSQPWEYLINLAYGVTTTRDPQTSTTDVLSYGDLVESGEIIGPRILATGPGIFARDSIRSLDDARDVMRRYSEFYKTNTIKQYMAGDRKVRQWVAMAAREQGIMPTLEGGLDFKKNMTEAMDGYSGIEHTLPIAPQYKDAVQLFAQSGTTYTPTLIVQYGGPWAENFWYETTDVVNDPKVNRFMPRRTVEEKTTRRPGWWAPSAYSFPLFAAQAAKIVAAGGRVGMGSHGQFQGLAAHWEIWNIASGGMPRHDVLRVGTIFGAEAIGMGKVLGSVEVGKLADLQVLDKNPLDDIRNTNTIRYVMKNGRLYDASTMNEIWPREKAVANMWWWKEAQTQPAGQDQ